MHRTDATETAPARRVAKYRLYIDEVGNHDLKDEYLHDNDRYLSLTGVMMDLEHVRAALAPALDDLKSRYFGSHPDNPVVLHRREMVRREKPFHALRSDGVRDAFGDELVGLVRRLDFRLATVVIDKQEHLRRYRQWTSHPYHYCVEVLLERFYFELRSRGAVGDVMAEARGGREDRALKDVFRALTDRGTDHVTGSDLRQRITSSEIKLKQKRDNVPGLQLADILAYPSWKGTRARHERRDLPSDFTGRLVTVLEAGKYRTDRRGRIDGYGRKWLP